MLASLFGCYAMMISVPWYGLWKKSSVKGETCCCTLATTNIAIPANYTSWWMSGQCLTSVADGGPTLTRYSFNVLCLQNSPCYYVYKHYRVVLSTNSTVYRNIGMCIQNTAFLFLSHQVRVLLHRDYSSQRTRDIEPMLVWCWLTVYDFGATYTHHWFNVIVSCWLHCLKLSHIQLAGPDSDVWCRSPPALKEPNIYNGNSNIFKWSGKSFMVISNLNKNLLVC